MGIDGRRNRMRRLTTASCRALAGMVLAAAPLAALANGTALALPQLEQKLASSLRLKAASSQIDYANHLLRQEQAKEGTQIYGSLDAGHYDQVVTNDLNRNYNAVNPSIGISYPLFGSHGKQLEAVQTARTQAALNSVAFDETRLGLIHDLRKAYVLTWQYHEQRRIAERYANALSSRANAATKLRQKGMWTDSEYLAFKGRLSAAQDDVQRFSAMERVYTNAMRAILGGGLGELTPIDPELPKVCASMPELDRSAQRNSALLRKLDAEMEGLAYDRKIGAGSSVSSNLHLGVSTMDEYTTGRRGYAAVVGVSVNMPANFQEADQANQDKLNAAAIANRSLRDQTRLDILAGVEEALENYQLARSRTETDKGELDAAREALREAKLRFDRVPQPLFDEVIRLTTQEYQASLREIDDKANVLHRTNDILLLAPDSCTPAADDVAAR